MIRWPWQRDRRDPATPESLEARVRKLEEDLRYLETAATRLLDGMEKCMTLLHLETELQVLKGQLPVDREGALPPYIW